MRKNILFLHHVSCMAGAERYLLSLIESLDNTYKVFFICQEPGPLSEALQQRGVVVHFMPLRAWRKIGCLVNNLRTIATIINFCKTHGIDLICSNNYRVASYAVWPAKFLKIQSVVIIQDFVPRHKLWKFNTFESDRLIAVSKSIARGISHYPPNKITLIYNGIDIPSFTKGIASSDVLRDQFPELKGKRVVGMVAHIIPLKGHKVFLSAMQRVAQRMGDVMFVIIGDSPAPDTLSLQDLKNYTAQLNLTELVIFTGSRDDVPSLVKSFDILVHPSEREAFGRVIMEAMALSVPVVATDCGGPGEIIETGESGYLVPVGDAEQITDIVEMLLCDEVKRKSIGQKGQQRIEQVFNISQTVSQVNRVFEQAFAIKGGVN